MSIAARLDFDTDKLAFAFRTALGACLALWLAWTLGLDHPQWAAMSVWAASQPLRGQLLEKSFFRFAGTVSGTIAGIALVLVSQMHPLLLVIGLAAWVAACTGIGNLQRGLVSYGTVLAGYTAAMVSLLDIAHPDNVLAVGADRLATVMTGVLVATAVGLFFARRGGAGSLRGPVSELVADVLDNLAAPDTDPKAAGELLGRIAEIEEGLDPHAAGSLRSRKEIRDTRAVLIALIAVLLQRDLAGDGASGLSSLLRQAAGRLRAGDIAGAASAIEAEARAVPGADLREALSGLAQSLAGWPGDAAPPVNMKVPVVLHRDWIGAREAAVRAAAALLAVGLFWHVSGWSGGNFMLLGLSVMISLFSTFESPAQFMRWVVLGQLSGVVAMLLCRWLVWPLVTGEAGLVFTMMPFILFGSLLVAHPRTTLVGFDYNMVFLLLMQPHWPLAGTFLGSLMLAGGVVLAPVFAWAMYLLVFPANLQRRIDTLLRMMYRDIAALARDPRALAHRSVWRARLYHRTLRLIRMSERSLRARDEAIRQGLEILKAGHAVQNIHAALADPETAGHIRPALREALNRAGHIANDPFNAFTALNAASASIPEPKMPPAV